MTRLLLLLCVALVLSGCTLPGFKLRTVKVALVAPFSGSAHRDGGRWLIAAKMAVEEWNKAHEDSVYKIELVASDQNEGDAVARRQVIDPKILAVVGYSDAQILGPQRHIYAAAGTSLMPMVSIDGSVDGERLLMRPAPASPDEAGEAFAIEYRRRWGESPNLQVASLYLGIRRVLSAYEATIAKGVPTRDGSASSARVFAQPSGSCGRWSRATCSRGARRAG